MFSRKFFLSLLSIGFFFHCHIDRKIEVDSKNTTRRVECKKSKYYIENLCEDEEVYLEAASKVTDYPKISDLNRDVLKKITIETLDVDKAASLFYYRSITDPSFKSFYENILKKEKDLKRRLPDFTKQKILFAVAPGMFYKDNPTVGADGKMLRDVASQLGLMETLIPLEQTGTIETNATILCNFFKKHYESKDVNGILLASVSKGSSDIKKAIEKCGNADYFKIVKAWYNIGGLNKGSYAINGVLETWRYRMEGRFYFWWKGYNWQGFLDMQGGEHSPVAGNLKKPDHLLLINIIGVPLFRHVTQRARPFYEYLIQFGPSDGLTLLADSYIENAITYPMWRQDHYFPWPVEVHRIQAILSYIVEKQFCISSNPCKDYIENSK